MPLRIKCKTCGSEDVVRDAWASWDVDLQKWILADIFDHAFCNACEGVTKLIDKETP